MSTRPIGDYALLSDCRSAALVSTEGSVDWLCLPRFDSPAVFGRLLDEAAGHWTIRPRGPSEVTRRYVPETLVLETTFRTPSGTVVLLDALAMGHRERGHALGASSTGVLLRQIACTSGSVAVETSFAPRPEFGLVHPLMSPVRGGLSASGGAQRLVLSAPLPLRIDGSTAHGETVLEAGQRVGFALSSLPVWGDAEPEPWRGGRIHRRLNDTIKGWRSWTRIHQGYQGPWKDQVAHSGRVLQALTFTPTGAIVAAATTSLPESIGADRNWDYRYTWVRDASFTLQALSTSACEKEKASYFRFLAQAAATQLDRGVDLQVMYGIGGERDLSERTLPHLSGWRGSAPVRTGNDAWRQHQLDVYGELLDAAHQTHPAPSGSTSPPVTSSFRPPRPLLDAGTSPTRAFGKCEVPVAIFSTRNSCAGSPSTGPLTSRPRSGRRPNASRPGGARARPFEQPLKPEGGTRALAPSPKRSDPASSTPQPSCCPSSDFCPATTPASAPPCRRSRTSCRTHADRYAAISGTISHPTRERSCCAPSGSPTPLP